MSWISRGSYRPERIGNDLMTKKKTDNAYFIFRASITVDGKKIYAKDYGKRAFRIPVDLT